MRFIIIALFLSLGIISNAQNYRYSYQCYFKTSPSMSGYYSDNDLKLDVVGKQAIFYNEGLFKADSLTLASISDPSVKPVNTSTLSKFANVYTIDLNYSNSKFNHFIQNGSICINGSGKLPKVKWSVSDEIRVIGEYTCKRADAEYLGRKWTIWFSEKHPTVSGPWLFYNAPGLIVQAYDEEELFYFKLTGIRPLESLSRKDIFEKYFEYRKTQPLFYGNMSFKESEAMHTRLQLDVNYLDELTGSQFLGLYDKNGKKKEIPAPNYIPLIPESYWK